MVIGGSETHIGIYNYEIRLQDTRTQIDTVIWSVDCPHWRVVPHGHGNSCTLYIHSLPEESVLLHATAINRCDTVRHSFAIQTTYFDLPKPMETSDFQVAPNPSTGEVTLRFGSLEGQADIHIYNALGQQIDAFSVDIDVHNELHYRLPDSGNGLYYIVLENNGATLTRKLSVIR